MSKILGGKSGFVDEGIAGGNRAPNGGEGGL
jgi:hypothetical protein